MGYIILIDNRGGYVKVFAVGNACWMTTRITYRYIRNKRGQSSKVPNIRYKRDGVETIAKSATDKAVAFTSTLFDNSEKADLSFD